MIAARNTLRGSSSGESDSDSIARWISGAAREMYSMAARMTGADVCERRSSSTMNQCITCGAIWGTVGGGVGEEGGVGSAELVAGDVLRDARAAIEGL